MILVYKNLYRSTESGNWQLDETFFREVSTEGFEAMKNTCSEIGMTYSEKYNEFFYVSTDKLHATKIIVK